MPFVQGSCAKRGCLCQNWKPSFLPRLIFNWRTFLKQVTALWWRQWAKNQVSTNQNWRNRWCQIVRQTLCKSRASTTSLYNLCLQIPCICSLPTPHTYSTSRHIWNPVQHQQWSFFVELVNVLKTLAIFAEELHHGCLTGSLVGF